MSASELACSLLPLPGLGCATWPWRTGSMDTVKKNRFWLVFVKTHALGCAIDAAPIST